MPNGTAVYHLEVLEREHLIKSERDGINRRFFPWGMKLDQDQFFPSEQQWRVINVILERAGNGVQVTQADLTRLMGTSKQALNYHVKRLMRAGVVHKEKGGILWVKREKI
jgi:predicted transcriptional regulator